MYKRKKSYSTEPTELPDNPDNSEADGDLVSEVSDNDQTSESDNESESEQDNDENSDEVVTQVEWSQDIGSMVFFDNETARQAEININVGDNNSEQDFFSCIFDDKLVEKIVLETNKYASQKFSNSQSVQTRRSTSRYFEKWTDITVSELKAWIGIQIIMGIHKLPRVRHYWSSDPRLKVNVIANVMTRNRFDKITEMIHVSDNTLQLPKNDPNHDKLHKIRPLIEGINENSAKVYKSSTFVSIDESMIPFKGRSSLKQYMPMKPIKRGYKVWCRADSETGYVSKFEIYIGKLDASSTSNNTLGERVVFNLMSDLQQTGKLVAFDNFFTTVNLVSELHNKGIFAVGTIRSNRVGLPPMMKTKNKMQRGDYDFQVKDNVAAIKWMDKRLVTLLTTAHNPNNAAEVQRKNKKGTKIAVTCPSAVVTYNKIMGGVDRFDQLKERYAIGRRSTKWWHRIFYYLIDLAIVNAYILNKIKKKESAQEQLHFRLRLANQLIDGCSSRKRKGHPLSFQGHNKISVPDDVRKVQVGIHMPEESNTRLRCRLCYIYGKERRTICLCTACKVPLCPIPCFKKFHEI